MNTGYLLAGLIVLLGAAAMIYATRNLLNANKNRQASTGRRRRRR